MLTHACSAEAWPSLLGHTTTAALNTTELDCWYIREVFGLGGTPEGAPPTFIPVSSSYLSLLSSLVTSLGRLTVSGILCST